MAEFQFQIEECDVEDKQKLATYRTKRAEWLELLAGDDEHSIWKQIHAMMWNDAVFRLVNETRRMAHQKKIPSSSLNGTIGEFIDTGYVTSQVLAIRRLTEPAPKNANPERQIVSLNRLLEDIKSNWTLITRENYICHDGLPYDYEPHKNKHFEKLAEDHNGSNRARYIKLQTSENYEMSEHMHRLFDQLSGTNPTARTRKDRMRPNLHERLEDLLRETKINEVRTHGNKFIAHAADQFSRRQIPEEGRWFSLDDYETCHHAICVCTSFIFGEILYEGGSDFIPHPQFDIAKSLEHPWAPKGDHQALWKIFEGRESLTSAWAAETKRILV